MHMNELGNRNQKTFRPKKSAPSGSKGAQLRKHIDATLGSGNLREAVRLPPGEDVNEWLALTPHWWETAFVVDDDDHDGDGHGGDDKAGEQHPTQGPVLGVLIDSAGCQHENAGFDLRTAMLCKTSQRYEYRWADGVQIKKPIEVSAPKYVEYLMDWIESQLDDESIFPQKLGAPFPPNFKDVVKTIFKRLFRVYAHIYHSHFQKIVSLKEEAHLNTCFKHFILFTYFNELSKCEVGTLNALSVAFGGIC
ncbi:MOB kinase activator 1A [Asimina triloba]